MRIVVSGSTGMIGSALVAGFSEQGHDILRLLRSGQPSGSPDIYWDPRSGGSMLRDTVFVPKPVTRQPRKHQIGLATTPRIQSPGAPRRGLRHLGLHVFRDFSPETNPRFSAEDIPPSERNSQS